MILCGDVFICYIKNYLKSKYKYNYMLLALLLITLFNTLDTTSTKFDYTNINQNQPINQNITNKTIIIYENYSMLDVFSHYDPKPISKHDLITFVSLLPKFSHYPINIRYLLDQYDDYMYQMDTFYSSLVSILYEDSNSNSETTMLQFVDNTNKKLYEFSNKCKTFCLNVVAKANQKHVFDNFSAFRLNKSEFSPNAGEKKTNKNTHYSKSDIFVSASASFLTGDFITPIYIVSDYLFSRPTSPHNSSPNAHYDHNDHNNNFTPNADLWLAYSKLYCINTFSMRIDYHDDIIYVVGDKIPYEFTTNFISIIQQNINQHLTKYSKDSIQFRGLENMLQQFEVIKLLVYKIEEFIVLDIYDKLTNIIQTSFLNPLYIFKDYIDNRINDLYKMNELANIDFPISQMEIKEQQQLNHVINQINEHIKTEIANQNKQKQTNSMFNAEQKVSMNKVLNNVKNIEFEAWASLYIYSPLKRTGLLVSKAVFALPEGITVGGLQGIYVFINNVVSIFIFNPITTSIIIFIGLSIIYVSVANSIIMIINFFKWIYLCVSFPFVSLYRFFVWLNSFDIDSYF